LVEEINAKENTHEDLMLKIVRKYWRARQADLLRDRATVEEIREELDLN